MHLTMLSPREGRWVGRVWDRDFDILFIKKKIKFPIPGHKLRYDQNTYTDDRPHDQIPAVSPTPPPPPAKLSQVHHEQKLGE